MSLMRLLSAGKSLMGSGEPVGRYRLDARYRLPKFGPAKNPFLKPVEAKPVGQVELQMAEPIQRMSEKVRLTPAEISAAEMKDTQRLPVPNAAVAQEKLHPVLAMLDWMEVTAIRLRGWVVKLNPARLLPKRKPATAMSVVQKSSDGPVQAELSLEKVRVMRNDLSDADLEVVPMKVQPKPVRRETTKVEVVKIKTKSVPELAGVEA